MQSAGSVQQLDVIMSEARPSKRKPDGETGARSSQASRREPVDWGFVAKLVKDCAHSHFDQDGSEGDKADRAQQALLPFFQFQVRAETNSYFTIDKLVFNVLHSPSLIKEVEELLFAHYVKFPLWSLQNMVQLVFEGKVPSYSEGGINAVAAFCERFSRQINISEDLKMFNTITRMAILATWNELARFRVSVSCYFDPLLYQLFKEQKEAEARASFIHYAVLQPKECAQFLQSDASVPSGVVSAPLNWALLLLEIVASQPFHVRFLDALEPLAVLVENAKRANIPIPAFDTPLIRILSKVQLPKLEPLIQWFCLIGIETFSLSRAHQFSREYMPFLKELLSIHDFYTPSFIFFEEYLRILHSFIQIEEFLELWPIIQRKWLTAWTTNPQQEQAVAQFFVHVAYRHPQAPLIPEMCELLAFKAKGFRSSTICEKDLLVFALVAHYVPETLSVSAPFSIDRFHKNSASYWRAIALLKGMWCESALALFAREEAKPFAEPYDHSEDLIEIPLRLDLLPQKKLESRLSFYIRTRRKINSFAPLFNLIETIGQKFTEGKLTKEYPLQYMPQLIGLCQPLQPPPPRLTKILQPFAHLGFLDPALFRLAP